MKDKGFETDPWQDTNSLEEIEREWREELQTAKLDRNTKLGTDKKRQQQQKQARETAPAHQATAAAKGLVDAWRMRDKVSRDMARARFDLEQLTESMEREMNGNTTPQREDSPCVPIAALKRCSNHHGDLEYKDFSHQRGGHEICATRSQTSAATEGRFSPRAVSSDLGRVRPLSANDRDELRAIIETVRQNEQAVRADTERFEKRGKAGAAGAATPGGETPRKQRSFLRRSNTPVNTRSTEVLDKVTDLTTTPLTTQGENPEHHATLQQRDAVPVSGNLPLSKTLMEILSKEKICIGNLIQIWSNESRQLETELENQGVEEQSPRSGVRPGSPTPRGRQGGRSPSPHGERDGTPNTPGEEDNTEMRLELKELKRVMQTRLDYINDVETQFRHSNAESRTSNPSTHEESASRQVPGPRPQCAPLSPPPEQDRRALFLHDEPEAELDSRSSFVDETCLSRDDVEFRFSKNEPDPFNLTASATPDSHNAVPDLSVPVRSGDERASDEEFDAWWRRQQERHSNDARVSDDESDVELEALQDRDDVTTPPLRRREVERAAHLPRSAWDTTGRLPGSPALVDDSRDGRLGILR